MMKANKQIGFIYKNNESIDRILKDGEVVFERGFLREKTSTTLPITFGGVGKDLKNYIIYGNSVQNGEPTPDAPIDVVSCGNKYTRLPSEYQELDYIESNGTQYINTLYIPNNNTKVDIKFMGLNNTTNVTPLFGGRTTAETETYTTFYNVGSMGRVDYGKYSPSAPTVRFINGRIHTFVKDKEKNYLDGEYVNSNTPIEFACRYPLYINSINTAGTPSTTGLKAKLYYTKIYDNNKLVRNLVPVVKKGSKNLFNKNAEYVVGGTTYNYTISGLDPNKYYTCSTNFVKTVGTASVYFGGGNSNINGVWSDTPRTFKPDANGEILVYIRYVEASGAPRIIDDVMNGTIWVMVNEGEIALPYDEYSPEQIGMYDLNATSENLLNRATCVENKLLTWASGTPYDETGSLVTDYMEVKIGDKFVSNYRYQKMFYDKNKNYLGALCTDGTLQVNRADIANTTTNFTVPNISDIVYVRLGYRKSLNSNTDMTTVDIMFNEGETALPYEPYQKHFYTNDGTGEFIKGNNKEIYEIPVNVKSENLFDKDNANVYGGYLSAGGVVSGNGNPSNYDIIVYIECKPNTTYALKKMLQSDTANNRFRVGCTSEIPVQGIQTTNFFKYNDGTTETQYVYTTSSNAKYLLFYCGKSSDTAIKQQILDSIVIVESSTVPSKYIPYYNETTNIPFSEVPTTRKIKKLVFDGTETGWRKGSTFFFNQELSPDYLRVRDSITCICSHYQAYQQVGSGSNVPEGYCSLYYAPEVQRFYIKDSNFATLEDFTTYLAAQYAAGTPVTIWYVLATEETNVISEPLCKIGNYSDSVSMEQAGVQIPTIDGNNTLNIETEITPSQVYIKYKSNE